MQIRVVREYSKLKHLGFLVHSSPHASAETTFAVDPPASASPHPGVSPTFTTYPVGHEPIGGRARDSVWPYVSTLAIEERCTARGAARRGGGRGRPPADRGSAGGSRAGGPRRVRTRQRWGGRPKTKAARRAAARLAPQALYLVRLCACETKLVPRGQPARAGLRQLPRASPRLSQKLRRGRGAPPARGPQSGSRAGARLRRGQRARTPLPQGAPPACRSLPAACRRQAPSTTAPIRRCPLRVRF